MSAADDAFAAAEDLIEEARVSGAERLDLAVESCAALDRLPDSIAGLHDLRELMLGDLGTHTQVSDLTPISGMAGLQTLFLNSTQISDLTPISGMAGLQSLSLDNTPITDLTPISGMTGLQRLDLDNTPITVLTPISGMTGLQALSLDSTPITDLTPISGLTGLQTLFLNSTQISDLTPVSGMTGLRRLWLSWSEVADLRPLAGLEALFQPDVLIYTGLHFANTPAARASPELMRLSQIKDHKQRNRETREYLLSLPPWPQPLPWEIPERVDKPEGVMPGADTVPGILILTNRIDMAPSPVRPEDQADPIKARLYARLPDAVARLLRYGNRYTEIDIAARALGDLTAAPFAEADVLGVHLEIAALADVQASDARKPLAERLDEDCKAALAAVLRLGPPVTLGHPDVDLFEARSLEFSRSRRDAAVAEAERLIALGLAAAPEIVGARLRDTSRRVAGVGDTGRVADFRASLTRNAIIALSTVAGALGDAATGYVAGELVVGAARFLVLHKDAIMATAPTWGETGYRWAEYIVWEANRIVAEARRGPNDD